MQEKKYSYEQVLEILQYAGISEMEARKVLDEMQICCYDDCNNFADYIGWYKPGGGMMHRVTVCEVHKNILEGFK